MFNSDFLQKFNLQENILDNKYNYFYVSYQFTVLKEHILNTSNYPLLMPRLHDLMRCINLGLSSNIFASFFAIQNLLSFLKRQIYTLEVWQLYEIKINLENIIEEQKNSLSNDLLETNKEQLHKEQVLIQLSEIVDILDQLIKINGGEL